MLLSADDQTALAELDARLGALLPPEYQDAGKTVQSAPMRSAGLTFAADGRVAWDQIWGSFCDLAMAGGPPHKGALLQPGQPAAIVANLDQYGTVVSEICRGIEMVTRMPCDPAPVPGWVRVECYSATMAGWLLRAITMENVAARAEGVMLDLPAAPAFRLDREIKNVVTVIAKTCHYWLEHMPRAQQRAIADLFASLTLTSPLIEPASRDRDPAGRPCAPTSAAMAGHIRALTGLTATPSDEPWLGVECADVHTAIWMMRALVAMNVLARREGVTLFVPVNPDTDPGGVRVWSAVGRVHRLASARTA